MLQRYAGNRATAAVVAKRDALPASEGAGNRHPALNVQRLDDLAASTSPAKSLSTSNAPAPAPSPDPANAESQLQMMARDYAVRVIESVRPVEKRITPELQTIAKANGGKLEGLDYKLKTVESLKGKLADLARTRVKGKSESIGTALAAEAANIKDALRYTITVPPEAYAALADSTLKNALQAIGATRIKASNAWADPDGSYKGFNSAYEIDAPSDVSAPSGKRVMFEVQIHTPASWEMKSEMHQQYEDARKGIGMSSAAKVWLNNVMRARWKSVKVPDGMEGFDDKMNKR